MDLQATRQINIDVSNHKYLSIDAKQYDRNLRYILITCYHQGSFLPINKNTCFASVRYRKPDNYGVFNTCEITQDGKILVELTEQMLAVAGLCYADIVIHENMNLSVNIVENADGSVEIIDTGNSGIISTMTFVVNVREAAFDNEEVESSYEYNALNDLLTEARRDYTNVMESCNESEANAKTSESNALNDANRAQSYAVGGTGTRSGEDTDNAKYYYELVAAVAGGIEGGFIPIGTITFAELATAEKVTGYVYNISDDFVTTDEFREGAGKSYTAGTNVFVTASGELDCLGGAAPVIATVDEIKEYLGI